MKLNEGAEGLLEGLAEVPLPLRCEVRHALLKMPPWESTLICSRSDGALHLSKLASKSTETSSTSQTIRYSTKGARQVRPVSKAYLALGEGGEVGKRSSEPASELRLPGPAPAPVAQEEHRLAFSPPPAHPRRVSRLAFL